MPRNKSSWVLRSDLLKVAVVIASGRALRGIWLTPSGLSPRDPLASHPTLVLLPTFDSQKRCRTPKHWCQPEALSHYQFPAMGSNAGYGFQQLPECCPAR